MRTTRRPSRPLLALLGAVVIAGLVAACSPPDETDEVGPQVAPEAGALPVTLEQVYAPVTVENGTARIAAMGVGDADTLLALWIKPTAIATFGDPKQTTSPWNAELIGDSSPTYLPTVSSEFGTAIDTTLATDPGLITAIGADPSREQFNSLRKVAPTVLRPAQFSAWQVPWEAQATQVGKAVGLPKATAAKIAETNALLAGLRRDHPQFAGKTAVVVTGAPDGTVSIYSGGDGRGQTLAGYGFTFPPALQPALTNGFYGSLSAERLDLLDSADLVVAVDWQGSNDQLRRNAAFTSLDVVRSGRVAYLDQEVGTAMSVPTVLTIPWVAGKALDPITASVR